MQEARDSGLLQAILINSRKEYMLHHQQQLFDEVPVRLVLLAPHIRGGNVRTKEREREPVNRRRSNRVKTREKDGTETSVMVA